MRLIGFVGMVLLAGTCQARGRLDPADYSAGRPLRIMPFGDSITFGENPDFGNTGGYRPLLKALLPGLGFPHTDFVGRVNFPASITDPETESLGGTTVLSPGIYLWSGNSLTDFYPVAFAANDPDIMLVMAGSNDLSGGRAPLAVAAGMDALLDTVFATDPSVLVFLGSQTPLAASHPLTPLIGPYNTALHDVYLHQASLGRQVFWVDLFSAITKPHLSSDGVHLSPQGYTVVAEQWAKAIAGTTPEPAPVPVITAITRDGGAATITFTTVSGAQYSLLTSGTAGLAAPLSQWTVKGTSVAGTGGALSLTDTTADADAFYAVRALP